MKITIALNAEDVLALLRRVSPEVPENAGIHDKHDMYLMGSELVMSISYDAKQEAEAPKAGA